VFQSPLPCCLHLISPSKQRKENNTVAITRRNQSEYRCTSRPLDTRMSGSNKEDEAPAGMKRNLSSKSCLKKLGNENAGEARSIPPSLAMSKSVSFHKIEIGQYPIELGDNPCATGPPIQIGWKPESKAVFPLDLYESEKPEPRNRASLIMPPNYRRNMLLSQGTTARELLEVTRESKAIQSHRRKSVNNMKWDTVNYALERARRKMKKVASLGSLACSPPNSCHFLHQVVPGAMYHDEDADGPICF
jgi:hypothetical protein